MFGPADLQNLKDEMLAHGWCQHHINHLSRTHDLKTFSYLATHGRPLRRLVDHKKCSQNPGCVAHNTDAATYRTRHVTPECDCTMIPTPSSRLIEIIRIGKIPLISLEDGVGTGATHRIQVDARSLRSKYIAVSHVWSDGLGNPNGNALPSCQISELKAFLTALKTKLEGPKAADVSFCCTQLDTYSRIISVSHNTCSFSDSGTCPGLDGYTLYSHGTGPSQTLANR